MASKTTPAQNETTTEDATAELLALLASATKKADALTPKPRSKGPRKLRTAFDTDAILAAASKLPADADYLELLDSLGIDEDSDTYGEAEKPIGPAIRTRFSQLINAGRMPENFRPIAPAGKPLYLANRAADALRAKLIDAGMTNEQIDAALADAAENAS